MKLIEKIRKNREKRKKFAHILAGLIILINAFDRYQTSDPVYKYYALAGIVFLLVALVHARIEIKFPWMDSVFFVLEGIVSFVIAADFFQMGKKALPFCYVLAGIALIALAFIKAQKKEKNRDELIP